MKIRYYADLWPGLDLLKYPPMWMPNPGEKSGGCTRVAIDVEFPDSLIARVTGVDHVLPEVVGPKVVEP